jgi:aldehyde dehydrogenase (NAD+)
MTPESGQAADTPDTEAFAASDTVARLRRGYATGVTRSVQWRKKQLKALARMLVDNELAIIEALGQDQGRAPFETWLIDIALTAGEARHAAKNVSKWVRRRHRVLEFSQLPARCWVEYEPFGTVLIIGAWNFPFSLTLGPAIGAIAAGNAVVLKPSEVAPMSSALLADLVARYLDNDAIAVIEGDGAVSQELIAQGFDRILFTGGSEVGRKVYESAARHLTPVTLELGGKNPVIVAADADIDVAAKRIAWTKLINSGQACVAPDYVLADAEIRDILVSKIAAAFTTFQSGGRSGKRIVNDRHFERLTTALARTKGTIVVGGESDMSLLQIHPTIVVDPALQEPLMCEEIFGPILPVVTVQSVDEAIAFVNSRPKPLAAYLFTKSKRVRDRVINEVSAGGIAVNHLILQFATSRLPFGGVGRSGMGAYHGEWGFEEFSHKKSVLAKPTRPDFTALVYPPYTKRAWKLARKLY